MIEGNWKLTGQTDSVPNLRNIRPWIYPRAAVQMEATLLVESTSIRVVPQHPQRHFGKSTVHEFLEHIIHQHATAASAAQLGQYVQRGDMPDACCIIIGIFRRDHLTECDRSTVLLDQEDR